MQLNLVRIFIQAIIHHKADFIILPRMNGPLSLNVPAQQRLRNRIESWADNAPDVEYSMYGPLDSFLDLFFPFADFWMVKAQAAVRELAAGHGGVQDSTDRSVNPNGRKALRADFIVTRFSATGHQDIVNLVIEVKPSAQVPGGTEWSAALKDLKKYLKILCPGLAAERGGAGHLRGVLILGTMCHSFQPVQQTIEGVTTWTAIWRPEDLGQNGSSITSQEFATWLVSRRNYAGLGIPQT